MSERPAPCPCCAAQAIPVRDGVNQSFTYRVDCSCFRWDNPRHEPCGRCRLHCACPREARS